MKLLQEKEIIFTPSLFYQFEKSPLWIWHDRYSDPINKEPISEFALKIMEDGVIHEKEYVSGLELAEVEEIDPQKGTTLTIQYMKEGRPLIYQGWLEVKINGIVYRGRPDLLEKHQGSSNFGDWIYIPVDIKSSSRVKKVHKKQLMVYCLILEAIQGAYPKFAAIINRHHDRKEVSMDEKIQEETHETIDEIVTILEGKRPPLFISSSTRQSPWFKEDLREANENNDIALIYNLRKDTVQGLREQGIVTFDDMANLSIGSLSKVQGASHDTLERAKLQAQSLIEQRPLWIGKQKQVEEAPLKLYFDIEGDPWLDIEYLFGFWVVGDSEGQYAKIGRVKQFEKEVGKYFLYFLAETPEGERQMWKMFLEWLSILPIDYDVYHFSPYERSALKRLAEEYGGSSNLETFQTHMIDLKKVLDKLVILPLYFYSIKDIAKSPSVNFQWRHEKAGGGQSIFWYEQWLDGGDRQVLQDIIDYNEDDVRATEHVHIWLSSNCST